MKEIILIKNGELALKGLNRRTFEDMLIKNMRRRLEPVGKFRFTVAQSTIVAEPEDEQTDLDEAVERIGKVFGIAGFSRAAAVEKDMDVILRSAEEYLAPQLLTARSFKVEAKRSDKKFPLNSPQICAKAGEYLLEKFPHLTVDVHSPDLVVNIEVRDAYAYIHGKQIKGAGGMPTGSAGRAALLISGGIDSPVAGYMMAKRGLTLSAVHFYSYPYTSERARDKVIDLARLLSRYALPIRLYLVPFTDIQMKIYDDCPEKETTVLMRRLMMKIAERIAEGEGSRALITGESLGQVASQTLESLCVTDDAVSMPVFRPLIGFDKDEIMDLSRKIGTYETSILPYEDCCTVFVPKHPVTKPVLEDIRASEAGVDFAPLIEKAIADTEIMVVGER